MFKTAQLDEIEERSPKQWNEVTGGLSSNSASHENVSERFCALRIGLFGTLVIIVVNFVLFVVHS